MKNINRFLSNAVFLLVAGTLQAAVKTGGPFSYKPPAAGGEEMVWYLVDWGDGTWTPTSHGLAKFSPRFSKVWKKSGRFQLKPRAITLSGRNIPLKGRSVDVTGTALSDEDSLIGFTRSSDPYPKRDRYIPQNITLKFDQVEAVDAVILERDRTDPFPESFCIEISTDGGRVWNDIPAASWNHFPDPGKNKVLIPLHGVMCDALRIVSYCTPPIDDRRFALRLGEIQMLRGERLFDFDADPETVADWNNMWLSFGSAENEVLHHFDGWWPTDRPDEGGLLGIGSTIWALWNSMKLSWMDDPYSKGYFERTVNTYPQNEEGLMGVAGDGFLHLGHSKHYVTPAVFISGISHWTLMHRNFEFLQTKDAVTGVSLIEKLRKAMRYQLETMEGKTGVLTIHDPEHDGSASGLSGNYWDGWRFGYQSAYANMLFFQSLEWMARLEEALGNADKSAEYRALRPLVKKRYNELFWNEETGRFAGWISKEGVMADCGFTFVNLEAIACGIATEEHAEQVLRWLDGSRTVKGDTSIGDDIYFWKVAPRANTLDAAVNDGMFWENWTMQVGPGTVGEYGGQIQNGGHIFYVSHYDLMSRLRTRGITDAMRRMEVILEEFHKDQLHRKPCNWHGVTHVEGILREFPESGLVPLFYLTGIFGLEPMGNGLIIAPKLPEKWTFAGVNEYWFAGKKFSIRIQRELEVPETEDECITVPVFGKWLLTPQGEVRRVD
ncbi:glucosidase family protein [Tichowtungia aerotolerans]|uniref:Glycosyl-hydrolase family 116 catalytic region domain-containing protein n=1 Tax=Tichowtungia aerotolerans TaxID=2697043 RepID=A0A6P1M979_9BACT|nr:hypothetical protein [Tichowtungia aerotolerans]QHI68638.1 hypothetical protein GT409_03960 [Tichowtungia aerotolerans]